VIHQRRNFEGLQALLGETILGIVCSDRWSVYSKLPLELRQICWAHLKRDFQKLIDRGGPAEAIGRSGLEVVECLFADCWTFRRGERDRPGLQSRLDPIARELQGVLEQGCSCADSKAATFCANVLTLYPALWLFTAIEGVEPTNNHAERILRMGTGNLSQVSIPQDIVFLGTYPTGVTRNAPSMAMTIANLTNFQNWLATCAKASATTGRMARTVLLGEGWAFGVNALALGNLLQPPNSKYPNCSLSAGGSIDVPGMFTLSSFHPGGCNVLMCDGTVKFLKDSTSLQTIWALGSRAQGEVIDASSY
jgi:prepilin-type processing-associated H-X9-DG protein